MALSVGTVLHQRYRIVKEVGRGGFGAVYRAWDMSLEQPVAVKENVGAGPDAARQFEREAKLLAGLKHPNLPRVLDHFVLPGQGQYLVMDFVEGTSLFDILQQRGRPLAEAEALPWIRQVCSALAYLHTRTPPVIHRDIKPDNIIITTDGQAMLVDFGISKVYDANNPTTLGAKAVTPGYSPLEQYGRGKTEARSDVYALGATLYTLLSGQTPPEAPDLASRAEILRPLHHLNSAVSMSTSMAVSQAMEVYVDQRPGSVAAFERALSAPPPPAKSPAASPLPSATPVKRQAPPPPVTPVVQQPAYAPASGRTGGSGASSLGCVLVVVGAFLAMALIVLTSGLNDLMSFLGLWLLSAVVIYIVGRLNLGLIVGSFTSALIAAAVIAIVSWLITWLLGLIGINLGNSTLIGVIVSLIVAAVVLMISDRFVSGMAVNGFVGALVAAVAIAVVAWLVGWLLGLLGFGADANPTTTLLLRALF